jgi:YD repeat-containing protein
VLVEKPFTLSMADAAALVHLAARAGRPLLVAQNYRYLRVFRAMRDTIAAGRLGRVTHVHWHYYRIPHDMAPSLARLRHSVLWGMGIHHLDALRVVLGDRVVSVSADLFTGHESSGLDGASFHVLLTLASGARAVYTATYESSGHEFFERGQEFHGRVVGERATLHAVHRWLWIAEGRRLPRPIPRGRRTITEEQMLLETFARAVRDGAGVEGEASGRDNLQTRAVAEACVRSAAERRTIDLEEVQP